MEIEINNEEKVALAFNQQSLIFDEQYGPNRIVQYKRQRVRTHLLQLLQPSSNILELNAGTGEDAIFLAGQGHQIHATDISEGMQEQLRRKVNLLGLSDLVSTERCSYQVLNELKNKGPFDALFSNFAGLNCTGELHKVLQSFYPLLKQGGTVTLVILPPFCFWETMLLFKGMFKTATRRFFSRRGRKANIDGAAFRCWYYTPSYVRNHLGSNYEWIKTESLCSFVPPSYIEFFAEKYPRLFRWLASKEEKYACYWPFRSMGDYYIISFRKK